MSDAVHESTTRQRLSGRATCSSLQRVEHLWSEGCERHRGWQVRQVVNTLN